MRALVIDADWEPRPGAQLSAEEREGRWALDARQAWRNPRMSFGEHPDPAIEAADEVIVRIRCAGVAGSNLRMTQTDAEGYTLLPYCMKMPTAPGHEMAGEVVETGPAVRRLRVGDPVTIEALRYCDRCDACRRGIFNHCENGGFSGFTQDGGMAQFMAAPERHVRPLAAVRERFDAQATYEIGALCEPAACAYVGMFERAGGFMPGAAVAVFGCGPIGLSAVALARAAGASKVIAFDIDPLRCDIAGRMGADAVFDVRALQAAGSSPGEQVMALTGGRGADVLVEAVGHGKGGEVLPQIEASLGLGAKVVFLGVEAVAAPFHTLAFQRRAASAVFSVGHLGGYDPVAALHAAGRIDLRPMITGRFKLGLAAMERAAERKEAKIVMAVD